MQWQLNSNSYTIWLQVILEKVNKMENALQILELQLHKTELKIELH